jgi:hypothetical protein
MPANLAAPAPPRSRELRASDGFGTLYAPHRPPHQQAACGLCDASWYWRSERRGLDIPNSHASALPASDEEGAAASVHSMLP